MTRRTHGHLCPPSPHLPQEGDGDPPIRLSIRPSVRLSPPPGAGRMIGACSLIQRDPISAGLCRKPRNRPALPYISRHILAPAEPGARGKGACTAPTPKSAQSCPSPCWSLSPQSWHHPCSCTWGRAGDEWQLPPPAASSVPQFPPSPQTRGWLGVGLLVGSGSGAGSGAGEGAGGLIPPPQGPARTVGPDQPSTPGVTQGHVAALLQ